MPYFLGIFICLHSNESLERHMMDVRDKRDERAERAPLFCTTRDRIKAAFISLAFDQECFDRLLLNRGWDTMIRPATAFRFRDRIFGSKEGSSLKTLFQVLGKWKDGKSYSVVFASSYSDLFSY